MMKKNPRIAKLVDAGNSREIFTVFLTTFSIMFFLYPIVSATLWDFILS